MSALTVSLFRLRVVADADPGAIARGAERFQNLNILPRRLIAEFGINDTIHIAVDVCGMPEEQLKIVAAKISQATSIVSAVDGEAIAPIPRDRRASALLRVTSLRKPLFLLGHGGATAAEKDRQSLPKPELRN